MIGASENILKRLTIGLIICVMGTLMVNKAIYTHVHVLPDGTVATHAHPFNKKSPSNEGKSHQHSNLELMIHQNLEVLFLLVFVAISLLCLTKKNVKKQILLFSLSSTSLPYKPGRAPPSYM